MARRDHGNEIVRRVDDLVANFDSYLGTFTKENPFTADQLRLHVDTIALRKRLGTMSAALNDARFVKNLYLTLDSWGMNSRGAKLVRIEHFTKALQMRVSNIAAMEGLRIDRLCAEATSIANRLWRIIDGLSIVETKSTSGWRVSPGAIRAHIRQADDVT